MSVEAVGGRFGPEDGHEDVKIDFGLYVTHLPISSKFWRLMYELTGKLLYFRKRPARMLDQSQILSSKVLLKVEP